MSVRRWFCLLAALWTPFAAPARAQAASPPAMGWPLVENVSARDARLAGPVWAVAETATGEIIAGTNQLLAFDGTDWRMIGVPGGYAFRALAAGSDGRVWIGGTGQLGYLDRQAAGEWRFTSLLAAAREAGLRADEELWHVAATAEGIVFVAPQHVLRWDGGKFTGWPLPAAPRLFAHAMDGRVFLHQPGVGLLRVDRDGPVLIRAHERLPEGLMLWAVAPPAADPAAAPAGWLVGTNDAAYRITEDGFERLPDLTRALLNQLPTGATRIDARRFAIGTYQRGVLVTDFATAQVNAIHDRRAGLPDDRVNHLLLDRRGRLWAGLSLGLARLEVTDQAMRFDARNGLVDGPVTRFFTTDDGAFAATSKTVYRLIHDADGPTTFAPLPALNTYVWDALPLGGEIVAAGFGGIWRRPAARGADPQSWQREHHVSADVFKVVASRYLAGTLFFTEGHALKALQRSARDWVPRTLVADLGDTPVSLLEDSGGDLWVSLMARGVRRYRIVDDVDGLPLALRLVQRFEPGPGLPADSTRPRLSLLGSHVVAFTDTAILAASDQDESGSFGAVPSLVEWIALAAAGEGREGWWLLRHRDADRIGTAALFHLTVAPDSRSLTAMPLNAPGLGSSGVITSLDVEKRAGRPVLWFGGADALLRVEPAAAPPPPDVTLHLPETAGVLAASTRSDREARHPDGVFEVRLFSPATGAGEPVFFQTVLRGAETDWSAPRSAPERNFVGLAPGRYKFEARAVDRWGRPGPAVSHAFVVPPPWFRSVPAITGYVIAGLLLIAGIVGLRLRALHRRAAELNALVQERTRELAAANAAKTEFLENISHEIRNPLNGILGLVAMLRDTAPAAREQELVGSLRACTQALARVFDDVLNFTRLEHGQIGVRERPFDLAALVSELVLLLRVTTPSRRTAITVRRTGDTTNAFVGDADKIESILSNFVGNALKYAPGSPVEIHVDVEAANEFGANVTFNVNDRGPGIPSEEQEVIFQKFVRGERARLERAAGTGLGLATCRALAELLGGHVGVESEVGRGSTFFLTLRLKRDRSPASASRSHPAAPLAEQRARSLIVEDQPYNQIVVRRTIEQLGYEVDVASDATEAVALLAGHRYAVVLVDWELPDLKGDEVARRLRALPGGGEPIVIATTAHNRDDIRQQGIAAGIDDFALKPFESETLARLIDAARTRRSLHNGLNPRVFHFVGNDDPRQAEQAGVLYLELLEQELATLAAAVSVDDRSALAQAAHRLKSHAGLVDAGALRDAADQLQRHAADGDPAHLQALHRELTVHAETLRERLKAWLAAIPRATA